MNSKKLCAFTIAALSSVGSAWLIILLVGHIINSVRVSGDAAYWQNIARVQAYGVCYNGCDDCLDVGSIATACRMTRKIEVQGMVCDANKMWFWADEEKFPVECLDAVGILYHRDQLERKRWWFKGLYVFVSASLGVGWAVYVGVLAIWSPLTEFGRRRRVTGNPHPSSRTPLLAAAIVALAMPAQVMGYRCISQFPARDQLFSNQDQTIYGVIHGWLSDCYDYTYSCGESCSTTTYASSYDKRCDTNYCTEPRPKKTPGAYVREAQALVKDCGFVMVDTVPGIVTKRIPNPMIEGVLNVKIAVNRFNNTEGLDKEVKCLYEMI